MILRTPARRPAATAVEMAVIAPVFFLLIFILLIGGLGIFRYNQVAHLAREGARYASVRGLDYHRESGKPAATQESIRQEGVLPAAVALDPSLLTVTASWDKSNAPRQANPDGTVRSNYVIVTVSYKWLPDLFFGGGTLTSTSKMPITY